MGDKIFEFHCKRGSESGRRYTYRQHSNGTMNKRTSALDVQKRMRELERKLSHVQVSNQFIVTFFILLLYDNIECKKMPENQMKLVFTD